MVTADDSLQERIYKSDMFENDDRYFIIIIAGLSSSLGLKLGSGRRYFYVASAYRLILAQFSTLFTFVDS